MNSNHQVRISLHNVRILAKRQVYIIADWGCGELASSGACMVYQSDRPMYSFLVFSEQADML